jgi:hypothetical protein
MSSPDRGLIMKLSATGLLIASGLALIWAAAEDRSALAAGKDGLIHVQPGQLDGALARARGGEHFRLAPGSYGRLELRGRRFAQPVTISGATGAALPRLDTVRVVDSSGLRLQGLEIGTDQPAADGAFVRIQESSDVVLDGAHVHGSLDGDPRNDGIGVHIADSGDVTISGSELQQVTVGVMVKGAQRVRVLQNRIHGVQSDGVISAAVDQFEIAGNYISDFTPAAGDHPDGIQLHNVNVDRGTTGVVIADNVIMQGRGAGLQGIWISDGDRHPHRDVTVANNLIYVNEMYNGIGINDVQGAQVIGNTVVSAADDAMTAWIRVENSSNVRLENNISDRLIVRGAATGLTRAGNMFFTGRATPECLFPRLNAKAEASPSDFVVTGLGFQPGPKLHPSLRSLAPCPLARREAARRCSGAFEE